jgi:hypothetical protein
MYASSSRRAFLAAADGKANDLRTPWPDKSGLVPARSWASEPLGDLDDCPLRGWSTFDSLSKSLSSGLIAIRAERADAITGQSSKSIHNR